MSKHTNRPQDPVFAAWVNDDLLIEQKARDQLAEQHPAIAPLLDWPALRAVFVENEGPANREKSRFRAAGRRAVWFALGAFVLAAIGALGDSHSLWQRVLFFLLATSGAVCATISAFIAVTQMLSGRDKEQWMIRRLWTETLRRFYFQFLLRHLTLAAQVIAGQAPLAAWHKAQHRDFSSLLNEDMQRPQDALQIVLDDVAEERLWVLGNWQATDPDLPPAPPALTELLQVLELKRIRIQIDYTGRKLDGVAGKFALRQKAAWLRHMFYLLVLCILGSGVVLGVVRAYDQAHGPTGLAPWIEVVAGILSALLIATQMWDRAEDVTGETERMEWYQAGVASVGRRYAAAAGDPLRQVQAMIDLESLAYREMRQFLMSVRRREFVSG